MHLFPQSLDIQRPKTYKTSDLDVKWGYIEWSRLRKRFTMALVGRVEWSAQHHYLVLVLKSSILSCTLLELHKLLVNRFSHALTICKCMAWLSNLIRCLKIILSLYTNHISRTPNRSTRGPARLYRGFSVHYTVS